jgi:hypothetical protein
VTIHSSFGGAALLPARTLVALILSAAVAAAQADRPPATVADPKPPPPPEVKPARPAGGLVVATDATWKAHPNPPAGWEKADFDDAKWDAVGVTQGPTGNGEHYSLANMCGVPTSAAWVWLGDHATFGIRRTFDAPAEVKRAELLLVADDEADVKLNGVPVAVYRSSNAAWGHRGGAAVVDLTPHLLPGKKNVLTATVKDNGAPNGFAAEVRVNSSPVLPKVLTAKPTAPPKEVLAEVDELAKRLDDPVFAARDKASRRLLDLTRTHGQGLYDKLNELVATASPEAGRRIDAALDRLDAERDAVLTLTGTDGRYFYPAMPMKEVKRWWTFGATDNPSAVRYRVQAKVLRDADPKAFDKTARAVATHGTDDEAANVVAFVADLELAELADVLSDALTLRAKTPAAALAASGLGRLGKEQLTDAQKKALTAAAKCGHEPTERAATAALAAIK